MFLAGFALGEHHNADWPRPHCRWRSRSVADKDALSEVVMHTDQGSEHTAKNYQAACARVGIKQSMGRAGSALDNAVTESWHSTVEFELRQLEHFATKDQARTRVATWIDAYNHDRRHSSLGMPSSQGTRSCLNHALALPTPGSPEPLHTAQIGRGHFGPSPWPLGRTAGSGATPLAAA